MDYAAYRMAYFTDPAPKPRFAYSGVFDVALYFESYDEALAFYSRVLGPPAYVEGENTHGWRIGGSWLTLFPAKQGHPNNVEITLVMASPAEAERLQQAFVEAGGAGEEPFDDVMYEPLRFCPVIDPFGTKLLIVARLEHDR